MIKLGDAYFDEASIVMIKPGNRYEPENSDSCYWVRVVGGDSYKWIADAAEVQRRLEEVGLIAPQAQAMPLDFSPEEIGLLMEALGQGYHYAAKESTGQVYAYRDCPKKGEHCWLAADASSRQTLRLIGEFVALSFADECPLDIAVALEGVPGC